MEKLAVNIGSEFGSPFGQTEGVGDLISAILSNAVVLASFILFLLLVFGGFSMIMGAGQNNPERAAKGKQAATAAAVGFIIIFASYWIIQIIQSLTGVKILNPPTLP